MKTVKKQLNNNKLLYVSGHDIEHDPGVEKKINGFCEAAQKHQLHTERITQHCKSIAARLALMEEVLQTDAKYIVFRSFGTLTIVVRRKLVQLRKNGHILICDQPSPLATLQQEIWNSSASLIKKLYHMAWGIISGPWAMWPYHRIIQYAPESKYFLLGNRQKTMVIGNGIDIKRIGLRHQVLNAHKDTIRLVGVANVSPHHGFDRIIRAIAAYNSSHQTKTFFTIIGGRLDSPIICSLKDIATSLRVSDYITFAGFQGQDYINHTYNNADLAVGSLGLYRLGLHFSSILKLREYCLAGIPFITAGEDPDFNEDVPFRMQVPNDDSIEPIVKVLEEFPEKRKLFTDQEIRQYAIDHLSFDHKFNQIMEGLL